jgi:Flp pilus assembly CpaE family ATPase
VRSGSLGSSPADAAAEALHQYAGVQPAALLPLDLAATDAALTHGRSLLETAKGSKLRKAFQQLAAGVEKDHLS